MNRIKRLLFILPAALLLSCGSLNDINVSQSKDPQLKSLKGSKATLQLAANVDNPTCYVLKLKKAEFDVLRSGYTFATLSLPKKLKVPKRSNQLQTVDLELHLKNPLALLAGGFELDLDDFTFTGTIKVGAGLLSKTMKFDNVTLDQLMRTLEGY